MSGVLEVWRSNGEAVVPVVRGAFLRLVSLGVPGLVLVASAIAVAAGADLTEGLAFFGVGIIALGLLMFLNFRPGGFTRLVLDRAGITYRPPLGTDLTIDWGEIDGFEVGRPKGFRRPAVLIRLHGEAYPAVLRRAGRGAPMYTHPGLVDPPRVVVQDVFGDPAGLAHTLELARQEVTHGWR